MNIIDSSTIQISVIERERLAREERIGKLTLGSRSLVFFYPRDVEELFAGASLAEAVVLCPVGEQTTDPFYMSSEIASFAPEPYTLRSPIKIAILKEGCHYTASHFETNIHASGDSEFEAIDNLKSVMLDIYDSLVSEPLDSLGIKAKTQRALLESIIERQC